MTKKLQAPAYPKNPGKAPKVVDAPFKWLQKIHGEEFAGYPVTSSAQRLGVLLEIASKEEAPLVVQTMVLLGLNIKGDIANTVRGNCVKHLPPRAGKYPLPKWDFPKPVANLIKRTYAMVAKEAAAEAKRVAAAASAAAK